MRYAWDLQHQYLREAGLDVGLKGWAAKVILHCLRQWDCRTANGVDFFVANSNFIARRIWKVYRRKAAVIYPPVDVEAFSFNERKDDFYFTASRMVPYKKIGLIAEAFAQMPDKKLVIVGDGPDFRKIKAKAPPNVLLLGHQPPPLLKDYLQKAKAFLFMAEEDFGIAPVEAQACGTPVIAYGKGGATETIRGQESENPTGVFFREQTAASLQAAIAQFESGIYKIEPMACRENALRFAAGRFAQEFKAYVEKCLGK
jgi:glycosyltransferase involved in cell wall biosynthesis